MWDKGFMGFVRFLIAASAEAAHLTQLFFALQAFSVAIDERLQ